MSLVSGKCASVLQREMQDIQHLDPSSVALYLRYMDAFQGGSITTTRRIIRAAQASGKSKLADALRKFERCTKGDDRIDVIGLGGKKDDDIFGIGGGGGDDVDVPAPLVLGEDLCSSRYHGSCNKECEECTKCQTACGGIAGAIDLPLSNPATIMGHTIDFIPLAFAFGVAIIAYKLGAHKIFDKL